MNPLDITIHQEDERGNVYALRQELRYQDLIVPIGYESDGASVPRFFWRYVFPPATFTRCGRHFCMITFTANIQKAGRRRRSTRCF